MPPPGPGLLLLVLGLLPAALCSGGPPPQRLARLAAGSPCGAPAPDGGAAPGDALLACLLGELYPPQGSPELSAALYLAEGAEGAGPPEAAPPEATPEAAAGLLGAVASLGAAPDASDELADLASGPGRMALLVFLTSDVGRVIGVERSGRQHRLAAAAGRAALSLGPSVYAVGLNKDVYAQALSSMDPYSDWELVGGGPVEGISLHDNVIYGVGGNSAVYKQSLSAMSPTSEWHLASTAGVAAITIHGGVVYGIGKDNRVWTQALASMTVNSTWELASQGSLIDVAVHDDTIYGVGTDLSVWKQSLSSMTAETAWVPAAKGSVERVAIHGDQIYAVAYDKRIWTQPLSTLSTETDWTLASQGSVEDADVSPRGFHPGGPGEAAPLRFLQGDALEEAPRWGGASIVYLPSLLSGEEHLLRLGWALSASLRPGAVVLSQRPLPGCWPGLLLLDSLRPSAQAGGAGRLFVYAAAPPPVAPQPAWMVSRPRAADQLPEALAAGATRAQWLVHAAGASPGSTEAMLWRLLVLAGLAAGLEVDASAEAVPAAVLREASAAGLADGAPRCAWEALAARARLGGGGEGAAAEALSLEGVFARIQDAGMADAAGRTLAWVAADSPEEGAALRVLRLLLERAAPVDAPDASGARPLDRACRRGHVEVARLLLAHRAAALATSDPLRRSPLHYAALHGHAGVAHLLLEQGASAGAVDAEGRAPWQLASAAQRGLVELLVSPGRGPWYEEG